MVYKIQCNICIKAYIGTNAHSCHKKQVEHAAGLRRVDSKYAVVKHLQRDQPDVDWNAPGLYTTTVLEQAPNSNMERYLQEAINIENRVEEDANMMLNCRGEWGLIATKRFTTAALELPS